ncbi:MAG: sigma-54-dependent Fis family transcriptional regulator [Polyangiaceae bacterium]|nr:sigma-54-dependent Fis family transcriptional regulator [Polyangiaceae bacterium]
MLEAAVRAAGLEARGVASGEAALAAMSAELPALVLLDLRMAPGAMDGLATLREVRARFGELAVALITGHGDVPAAVAAMKLGALDFLEKPIDLADLRRLLREVSGREDAAEPRPPSPAFGGIVSASPRFVAALELLAAAAASTAPVLLRGESGTGKELAAAFVHAHSPRAAGPFVKVNCAAIAPSLLESEMFGHEAGAFTGADKIRPGRFEVAEGGTLLLDEIGELAAELQAKLLRVLQEKELERVGSSRTRRVDVRVLATTNRDLEAAIAAGRFREDLYFRLNVFEVVLPPLRERPEDILPLAHHFIAELAPHERRRLAPETEELLRRYRWPGNVRELRNAIERATILARGGIIHPEHLPPTVGLGAPGAARPSAPPPDEASRAPHPGTVHELERQLIVDTLAAHDGNRTHAARALGMSRRALLYKIKRYGLGEG